MNLHLATADLLLRGAAGAMLGFQLVLILTSRLPAQHRWTLAAFGASVLAYMLCSHANFASFAPWLKLPALSACLMTAPLLWLAMRVVFADQVEWSLASATALAFVLLLTFLLGWLVVAQIGGLALTVAHKLVLIGFAAAALWTVVKDWQSDLLAKRRALRIGVTATLAVYVLLVLGFELAYVSDRAPAWLDLLNLAGITALSATVAFFSARYPLDEWLGLVAVPTPTPTPMPMPAALPPSLGAEASPMPPIAPLASPPAPPAGAISVKTSAPISAPSSAPSFAPNRPNHLTPPPPELDRKAALRQRLLEAMGTARAYAKEGLSVALLAQQLGATPEQLREVINQTLGYRNFNDFLHHYRIDEAAQRLQRQDLPILSIALDVGYGSIGPFNRAFKQIKGLTPSEFRAGKALN